MNHFFKLSSLSAVFFIVFLVLFFSGCQESQKSIESDIPQGPFFYPAAPDAPRIQFLKSFTGSADVFEKKTATEFESFLMGDELTEDVQTDIHKPYGFALYDNKFYICDLNLGSVTTLDTVTGKFQFMTRDNRMVGPINICIDNGVKYVADIRAGAVFVFDKEDKILAIWGREESISPIDVAVYEDYLYVLDAATSQVVVLDKFNGKEIKRLGARGDDEGQLKYVSGLAVDNEGNVYVSDKIQAHVTKLDSEGVYQQTIGFRSGNMHGFLRPKGLDIDNKGRMWIVDSSSNMGKVFSDQGSLLLYFSESGTWPGDMYLPASIRIDYDHIDQFQKYAVEDAEIECLIIVSNQYGPNKIAVYGLGEFPGEEKRRLEEKEQAEKDLSGGVVATEQAEGKSD